MPPTTTVRNPPCNSSPPPPMSSARPSGRNTGSEPSLLHLHDRMNQLDSRVLELKSTFLTEEGYVDRRNRENEHIRRELETHRATSDRIEFNVGVLCSDVDQIRTESSQLRTELVSLDHKMSHQLDSMNSRMDSMASHMRLSDRVRFNSLAHTSFAPISPVPVITDNGVLEWPKYFPRTVWKFWCLKNRSRVHRLVELTEFYKLGGYQDWSRMHQADMSAEDDSSDSSDGSLAISREEAVRRFPEAAHQALAATLGLVYYKIRNEMGEGPHAVPSRPLKRQQGNVASESPRSRHKIPRRPSVSETFLQQLINGPSGTEPRSSASEEFDKLGWKPFSDVSEDAMSKLRSIDSQDIGAVLRALEQGRLKLKPSGSEKANESKKAPTSPEASPRQLQKSTKKSDVSTEPKTPTLPSSSPSRKAKHDPETASNSNSDSTTP